MNDKMRELVYRLREEANMVRGLTAFTGVYQALNDASDALLAVQSVQSKSAPIKLPTDAAYRWLVENGVEPESTIHTLGKRLAELLDEDQFAECETLLLKIVAQSAAVPVVGNVVAWLHYRDHNGTRPTTIHLCGSDGKGAFEVVRKPTTSITTAELERLRIAARALKALLDRDLSYVDNVVYFTFESHTQAINRIIDARNAANAAIAGAKS